MAIRTTAEAVGGIVEVDASISLVPFIEVASALVDEVCDVAEAGYSAARLELIERWLTAHFYCVRDPRSVEEQAGKVREVKESNTDLNLASSKYGQMAMTLDTYGGLAGLNQATIKGTPRRVSVSYLGTKPETITTTDVA
jgi:hypothetical protein